MIRQKLLPLAFALGMGCSNPIAMPPDQVADTSILIPCVDTLADPSLRPYQEILRNEKISSAIGFCDLPRQVQDFMWEKLAEAEDAGIPPTVSFSYPINNTEGGSIVYDEEQAFEIAGARLAHALWLDRNEIIPWRLSDYSRDELSDLLSPQSTFLIWDPARHTYRDSTLIDHDPAVAYSLALEALASGGENQESAIIDLADSARGFIHGINARDEFYIRTLEEMHDEGISIYGCASMSYYLISLARAINIPARTLVGYYAAKNHTSVIFESEGFVLAHGDNIYEGLLRSTPTDELLDDLAFWQDYILIYPPRDEQVRITTKQHNRENAMRYPSFYLTQQYCREGWPYLDDTFHEFADAEEINDLEERIVVMTDGCRE